MIDTSGNVYREIAFNTAVCQPLMQYLYVCMFKVKVLSTAMYSVIGIPQSEYNRPQRRPDSSLKKTASRANTTSRATFKCAKEFCMYTTIHGFNHIAMSGRHWLERLLWACVTVAAFCGAVGVSLGQWARYNNPTVVSLEKDFRSWLISMPAITGCHVNRVDNSKLKDAIQNHFSVDEHDEKYDYYKSFVITVANSDLLHLQDYKQFADDKTLENVDLFQLVVDVLREFSRDPQWTPFLNVKWIPIMTEFGLCQITNSIALANIAVVRPNINDTKRFPLKCKYSSQRCLVLIELETEAYFWIHSPYDIADTTLPAIKIYPSYDRTSEISIMETACWDGIRELSPQRRGCLYTDEPEKKGGKVYSTNTCRLSFRSKLAIKMCGCRPFYYFYEDGPPCTAAGMLCLSKHSQALASNGGNKYTCSPQCLDSVYREVSYSEQFWTKGQFASRGSVKYLFQFPRSRYTREIVFHFQDLIVSFGGAAGLFLGASFISFVEIIYFVLERLLKLFLDDDEKIKQVDAKKAPPLVSYEAARIIELNNILENQTKYDIPMKSYDTRSAWNY